MVGGASDGSSRERIDRDGTARAVPDAGRTFADEVSGEAGDAGGRGDASTLAYERIRRDIVSGALGEGERLTEARLAARLGLSRTPVRAAIGRLVHEGFVERGSGYSTRVARFPEDELEQIFALRLQLEGYAARRAAQFADEAQIAALRALAYRMSGPEGVRAPDVSKVPPPGAAADDGLVALSRLNERFHSLVVESARSPRLLAMLVAAIDVGVVARTYRHYSRADLARSLRHHHELVDAIAARAPEWAESVMRSHLLAAQTSVCRERGPDPGRTI